MAGLSRALIATAPFGRCPQCRYSLEGLPPIHRCPECGFAYDAHTVVFRVRQARELATLAGVVLVALGLIGTLLTKRMGVSEATMAWIMVCVGVVAPVMTRSWFHDPFVAITPTGVVLRRLTRAARRIQWADSPQFDVDERRLWVDREPMLSVGRSYSLGGILPSQADVELFVRAFDEGRARYGAVEPNPAPDAR